MMCTLLTGFGASLACTTWGSGPLVTPNCTPRSGVGDTDLVRDLPRPNLPIRGACGLPQLVHLAVGVALLTPLSEQMLVQRRDHRRHEVLYETPPDDGHDVGPFQHLVV